MVGAVDALTAFGYRCDAYRPILGVLADMMELGCATDTLRFLASNAQGRAATIY